MNHARDWQYTVSLSIDNAIIPNHIFDDMDQLNSLELIDSIIVADDGAADCLFKNLKTNKTLKSLSLEYPMLYTGMGKMHVKPYFDAINSLFGKDSMIDLAKALAMNKTLTSLNIQANLRDENFLILESVLKNHPSISLWSL